MANQTRAGKPAPKSETAAPAGRQIRIVSRRDGFRRCGIAHPATPTFHDVHGFTLAELDQLRRDPMLIVDVIDSTGRLVEGPIEEIEETGDPSEAGGKAGGAGDGQTGAPAA